MLNQNHPLGIWWTRFLTDVNQHRCTKASGAGLIYTSWSSGLLYTNIEDYTGCKQWWIGFVIFCLQPKRIHRGKPVKEQVKHREVYLKNNHIKNRSANTDLVQYKKMDYRREDIIESLQTSTKDLMLSHIRRQRIKWEGHITRTEETWHMRQILETKVVGTKCWGRPRQQWEDNIQTDPKGIGEDATTWKEIAQDRRRWEAVVKVRKIRERGPVQVRIDLYSVQIS